MVATVTPSKAVRRLESIQSAADYAGVSPKTIRRWGSAGRIVLYRAGPRLIRVDLNELDDMLRPIPTAGGQHAC
jgi:excisionase family DNA binding protein